ncbi:MAG: hypothetical protein JKY19_08390 [Alcanivoracaceae bacterium]|nr:hypothetical protein [Alcanivoracaceae bacterium]
MNFPPDLIEERVASIDQAWELLNNKQPQFNKIYTTWYSWYKEITLGSAMQGVVSDAFVISYARMSLRNGSLSINPRNYHSEQHIDELIHRLISISQMPGSDSIPAYGWSLLTLFMSSHDLRQSEHSRNEGIIGNNEQASYQEISRLISQIDKHAVIRQEHKELLKLMIHGSTFGEGKDVSGNIYQGNLVKYILEGVGYFDSMDKELAYLACDIDTANVAIDLSSYAQSSIDVYNEIQNISKKEISAQMFFGNQQQQYFFESQKFNSQLGMQAFAQGKSRNSPKIKKICQLIVQLDKNMANEDVVEYYQSYINAQCISS